MGLQATFVIERGKQGGHEGISFIMTWITSKRITAGIQNAPAESFIITVSLYGRLGGRCLWDLIWRRIWLNKIGKCRKRFLFATLLLGSNHIVPEVDDQKTPKGFL